MSIVFSYRAERVDRETFHFFLSWERGTLWELTSRPLRREVSRG